MKRSDKIGLALLALMAVFFLAVGLLESRAADLPTKRAAPAPAFVSAPVWSGLHVGVNAGYTWSDRPAIVNAVATGTKTVFTKDGDETIAKFAPFAADAPGVAVLDSSGFIGGGEFGYDWQFGNIVFGLGADFDGLAGADKTATFVLPGAALGPSVAQIGRSWDWAGTAGPRLGYAIFPDLLFYVRGGAAFAHAGANVAAFGSGLAPLFGPGEAHKVFVGWTAGAGAEFMFAPTWSAKIEYRYLDFGERTASFGGVAFGDNVTGVQTFLAHSRLQQHAVLVGVDKRFDFGL